jgi:hypothetical protein
MGMNLENAASPYQNLKEPASDTDALQFAPAQFGMRYGCAGEAVSNSW